MLYLPSSLWLPTATSKASSRRSRHSPFQLAIYCYLFLLLLISCSTLYSWQGEHTRRNEVKAANAGLEEEGVEGRVLRSGVSLHGLDTSPGGQAGQKTGILNGIAGANLMPGGNAGNESFRQGDGSKNRGSFGGGRFQKEGSVVHKTVGPVGLGGESGLVEPRETLNRSKEEIGRLKSRSRNIKAHEEGSQDWKVVHHQALVSKGQPSEQPAIIDTNHSRKDFLAQGGEERDFRVTAIEPAYGLRSGGYAVLIRGRNFGPMGSSLLATIGDVPCNVCPIPTNIPIDPGPNQIWLRRCLSLFA